MGYLLCIKGKSNTGKDSIAKKLLKLPETRRYVYYTTRPMRDGEKQDVDYHFVTENTLNGAKERNTLVECRQYGDWKYFTIDNGEMDEDDKSLYICTPSPEQCVAMKKRWGDRVIEVTIETPLMTRLERYIKREKKQKKDKADAFEIIRRLHDEETCDEWFLESVNRGTKRFVNDESTKIEDVVKQIIDYVNTFG